MKKISDSNRGLDPVPNSDIPDWGSGTRPTVSQAAINAVVTETNNIINNPGVAPATTASRVMSQILGKR
jgi:hypothetical protein